MADAAEAHGASLVLINPLLQDRQSSGGLMGVRGRSERLAFADSFQEIYHFRLLYSGTTFMFPILGAVRYARPMGESGMPEAPSSYALFQRREHAGEERYEPVGCFPGREPTTDECTKLVPRTVQPLGGDAAPVAPDEAPAPASAPLSTTDKFAPPSW